MAEHNITPKKTLMFVANSCEEGLGNLKGTRQLFEDFGDKIEYMGEVYYSFPSPETISQLSLEKLSIIRAGFRDKYILDAVLAVLQEVLFEIYINRYHCWPKSLFSYV